MPTYEYKCEACGNQFEKFHSITAKPIRKCPKCGKNKVRRLLGTGAGMIFKGSGFYITDYRSEGYKSAAKADSAGGTTETKSTDTKSTETKSTDTKSADTKTPAKVPAAKSPPKPTERSKSAKK
jgi:putative FmdB family regulatory protein